MEFPGHPIFQDPVFETPEYKAFELRVRGALAAAVEQDPHTIAIQKAIPAAEWPISQSVSHQLRAYPQLND
jgi:hypothetical protein